MTKLINRLVILSFLTSIIFITLSSLTSVNNKTSKSAGAPVGTTGAPLESTCALIGCHTQYPVDIGNGIITIDFDSGKNLYVKGTRYKINLTVNDSTLFTKFGFQIVALQNTDTAKAGKFVLTNAIRTQILIPSNTSQFYGREYVTHTFEGTYTSTPGKITWSFDWIAPANYNDSITFYLSTNSCDNNGEMAGDYIYTRTLTIFPDTTLNVDEIVSPESNIEMYPNPAKSYVMLNCKSCGDDKNTSLKILDINGKQVYAKDNIWINSNVEKIIFPDKLFHGIYLVKLYSANQVVTKKILIQ